MLRHASQSLGGASVLIAAADSPVLNAAKLAKVTVDCRWEEVFRRYDPAHPWDRGRLYIMSNNTQIRKSMYGFRDPALGPDAFGGSPQAAASDIGASRGSPQAAADAALPHGEFVRMLAAMLMDGARVDHSEFKYGMYQLMRTPSAPTNQVRDKCRLAIVRALRPREKPSGGSPQAAAVGSSASPACPASRGSPPGGCGCEVEFRHIRYEA